jgi:hypothetical protein
MTKETARTMGCSQAKGWVGKGGNIMMPLKRNKKLENQQLDFNRIPMKYDKLAERLTV